METQMQKELRKPAEIAEAEKHFKEVVWYGRHKLLCALIADGEMSVVQDRAMIGRDPRLVSESRWIEAQKTAARIEEEIEEYELNPHSDFRWGMINGKLSTLRWVLGEEWDNLDT
jgi:hypothetical protein